MMTSFLPRSLCSVSASILISAPNTYSFMTVSCNNRQTRPINTRLYYQICSRVSSWQRKRCGRATFWHDETHTHSHDVASTNQVTQVAETWTVIVSNFPHVQTLRQTLRQTLTQTRALLLNPSDAHKLHDSLQTLTYYLETCKELTESWRAPAREDRVNTCTENITQEHEPVIWTCNNINNIRLLQDDNCVFWYIYVWLISLRHEELFLVCLQSKL